MAMQSGIGVSKILILAGAGYTSTVLLKNGKLSDLLGELQSLLNGSGEQSEGDFDDIASQVRRLAAEVRQLGSSRNITVLNGNGGNGHLASLIVPAATLGAVGYCYMWWKGLKFSDLMYVTKRSMTTAVTNLHKSLDNLTDIIAEAKKHLTQRVENLDHKMLEQNELSKTIKQDVGKVQNTLDDLNRDIQWLESFVSGLDGKIGSLEKKQDYANAGVSFLVNFVDGKKLELPQDEQKLLKDSVRSHGRLLSEPPSLMGLKEISDQLGETFKDGIDTPAESKRNNLLRWPSIKV